MSKEVPQEADAAAKNKQSISDSLEMPGSAPAVPTEVLRKLTEDFDAAHQAKKTDETTPAAPKTVEKPVDPSEVVVHETAEATPEVEDDGLSDPDIDRAVDDIVAKEGDAVLAAEDAQKEGMVIRPRGLGQKIKAFFKGWWQNKWARWITILAILVAIAVCAAIPKVRYAALNSVGVRSSLSLVVIDNSTQLPLKNVMVEVGSSKTVTDINGKARVEHLKLGTTSLKIHRIAFAPITKQVVVGWGSNPQGEFTLKAVGTQYVIKITDYLSGKPLADAEATSDGIGAISDKDGKITLTVDNKEAKEVPITLILSGYRDEQLVLPAANTLTTSVQLVSNRKEVFVSKQSGKYDLYKVDIDGKNRQVLLPGTGIENSNISLVVSPAGDQVALVSTRDNMRDRDGFLLSTLTLVDVASGRKIVLDHAEQLQIIGWVDHRLIYNKVSAGTSAANPQRYRLQSYDYTTNSRIQLANANQFNGILVADGVVYYATTATDPGAKATFSKIRPDGAGRQAIASQEIWTIFRSDYNNLLLQTDGGWLNYSIQSSQLTKASAPPSFVSRLYVDSPDGQQSLWTDLRDGKGVLLSYSLAASKDTELQTQSGLAYPVRWLSNSAVIYRVTDRNETADYVLSTLGGQARKITDVTHTYGIAQGN